MDECSANTLPLPEDPSDEYARLPLCVQQYYSRDEYLWLTDEQQADLIRYETEPEWT